MTATIDFAFSSKINPALALKHKQTAKGLPRGRRDIGPRVG
jgi:hypothetical protein